MSKSNNVVATAPPVLEGLSALGLTMSFVADCEEVSKATVSRWCRGEVGIPADHLLTMTALLKLHIGTVEEALEDEELPDSCKLALRVRLEAAKSWLALQEQVNTRLPPLARGEALSRYDLHVTRCHVGSQH